MASIKGRFIAIATLLIVTQLSCSGRPNDSDASDASFERASDRFFDAPSLGRDGDSPDRRVEDVVADASLAPDGTHSDGDSSVLIDHRREDTPLDAVDEMESDTCRDIGSGGDGDALADSGASEGGGCKGSTGGAIDLGRVVSDALNLYFIDRGACAILTVQKAGGTPVMLVQMATPIHDLATDGSNAYFTTASAVHRCALTGCGGVPSVVSSQGGDKLVTDGTDVYVANGGKILKCSVNGCGASPGDFATYTSETTDMVTDGVMLVWSDLEIYPPPGERPDGSAADSGVPTPRFSWCPLTGCAGTQPSLFMRAYAPYSLSIDGSTLAYVATTGLPSITTSSITSSGPLSPAYLAAAFDGTLKTFAGSGQVYWWDSSRIFFCAISDCHLMPSQFAVGENVGPSVVASDASAFYWFEQKTSTFHRCPLGGCDGTVLDAQGSQGIHPPEVAASGDQVYWLTGPPGTANGLMSCTASNCAPTGQSDGGGSGTPAGVSGLMTWGPYRYFFDGCDPGQACYLSRSPTKTAATGTVAGAAYGAPLTLRLNTRGAPVETLQLVADGPFKFQYPVGGGEQYSVEIDSMPPACRSTTLYGGIGGGDVTSVAISCRENSRLIGGNVQGLEGDTIALQNNGVDIVEIRADGQFSFPTPLAPDTDYDVTILTPPKFRSNCWVRDGKGRTTATNVSPLDVTEITVLCSPLDAGSRSSGLSADSQYLYWVQGGELLGGNLVNGAVVRMSLDGGNIEPLASALVGIDGSSTAIDTTNVYFSAIGSSTINKVPIGGGTVTTLAGSQTAPTSLVRTGAMLFWATATDIVGLDLATPGATPMSIAASPTNGSFAARLGTVGPPRRLVYGNGYLYWVSITDSFQDSVERAGVHGENRTVLVSRESGLGGGLALAGQWVFFSGTVAELMRVPAL